MGKPSLKAAEARAQALGFEAFGVTRLRDEPQRAAHLAEMITHGRHGTMDWLAETYARRSAPQAMWPEARSAIVLGLNYGPDADPRETLPLRDTATISVYARNRDYHEIIKGRLKDVAGVIARDFGCDVKVFVDTAPLMEKPLAQDAGIGWQGKHTNLVSRDYGSWLFLGVILVAADLPEEDAEVDHCGSCRACLDACPTNAFPAPYKLDARRCISYLTIEHAGPIAPEFRPLIGNRIYGCDDCLAACPWNKFASTAREAKLHARDDLRAPKLAELLQLDDPAFRAKFSGSPIKRIGRDRFMRNVVIAAGNSKDVRFVPQLEALAQDQSPLVRGAAVWALAQLGGLERLRSLKESEWDRQVLAEWDLSLGDDGSLLL